MWRVAHEFRAETQLGLHVMYSLLLSYFNRNWNRPTAFSGSLPYRIKDGTRIPSQILRFLQIEGFWQPCVEQVSRRHFSNSMCSLSVSVSHFGNFRNISNIFIIIISVMVIGGQ
jgi:hypothetical protein